MIGTTYGAGDGSTTFNLPNLIDRFAEGGKSVGTKKEAGLPNIKGTLPSQFCANVNDLNGYGGWKADTYYVSDAFTIHTWGNRFDGLSFNANGNSFDVQIGIDASKSNGIYGSSDTVQPPALVLLPIIKY